MVLALLHAFSLVLQWKGGFDWMSNSICFPCFSGDRMAEQSEDLYLSEEESSDSPSSGSSSEATVVPTSEDSGHTEENSPEISGQE